MTGLAITAVAALAVALGIIAYTVPKLIAMFGTVREADRLRHESQMQTRDEVELRQRAEHQAQVTAHESAETIRRLRRQLDAARKAADNVEAKASLEGADPGDVVDGVRGELEALRATLYPRAVTRRDDPPDVHRRRTANGDANP